MKSPVPTRAEEARPGRTDRGLHRRVVNIRYFTDYPECNYSCTYCIAGHGDAFPKPAYRWDPERYLTILGHLASLPFPINVRLGVGGEFFLDRTLVEGARRLSLSHNAASVNLITNLSFSHRQYKKLLTGFRHDKVAIVASFHPTEVEDHEDWLETARSISKDYDLAIVMVAHPPYLERLAGYRADFHSAGIETFIQPFIGWYEDRYYPRDYTPDQRELLRSVMYSRHDVEYLLNLKQPGLCLAGSRSLFVNPVGEVFPCGMGPYPEPLGNLAESSDLKLLAGPRMCPFEACQCDTENMNTVQFEEHYEFSAINQHRYTYRFRDEAVRDPSRDEWTIDY